MSSATPHNTEAEIAVLGAVLLDETNYDEVEGWLRKDVFHKTAHKLIWKTMKKMKKDKKSIDIITTVNELREADKLKEAGGAYYLTELVESIPSTENIGEYAKIVYSKYVQRMVIKSSQKMQEVAINGSYDDTSDILVKHQRYLSELEMLQPTRKIDIEDVIDEAIDHALTSDDLIQFGIPALDAPASGMTRGEITVVGGRPSHGKSTLMANIVHSLSEPTRDLKVMLFNLEMKNPAMVDKLIVLNEFFRAKQMRQRNWTKKDVKTLESSREVLKNRYKNLLMYDDIRHLEDLIREIKRYKPDVIIVDYIQLVKVNINKNDRRFEIEEVMNEFKWIAKALDCAVILVSQLSREIEKRVDPKPRMSDFAEGGTIEQVAESAIFIFYGYVFNHEEYDQYTAEMITAKSRYGEVGAYEVGFNGDKARYFLTPAEAEA